MISLTANTQIEQCKHIH